MKLVGERILLRPITGADEAAVHAYASDPAVTRYMDWGPNTPADTAALVAEVAAVQPPASPFGIVVDGELVGAAHLQVASEANRRAEVGYVLRRSAWGHGYATEATRLLMQFAFGALGLHKVVATCDPDNVASARVLTKAGLVREGYLRDHLLIRGEWRDRLLFGAVAVSP